MSQVRAKSIKRKIKNIKSRRDIKRQRAKKMKYFTSLKNKNRVRKISKARFEALSYARKPLVKIISEEVEWFSNKNNAVLGSILLDLIDSDYVAMVLGRDESGVFRCIDIKASINTLDEARDILISTIITHSKGFAEEFPQGVIKRKKNLIFKSIVSEDSMSHEYRNLINLSLLDPAKELIQEIAYSFEDPDGNYIEQFQSTGFNSRLWELYLYALFHELNFEINRGFNAPDYVIEKLGSRVCVEAVTINPSQTGFDENEPKTTNEFEALLSDYIPIKYGSSLFSKLQKKYWEKEHVTGHPLLIAVHDFHQKDSMMWSRPGLETYLYGIRVAGNKKASTENEIVKSHEWKGKKIPSNFFSLPDAENISAVIHSNQATIGKFLRMGYLAEFGCRDLDIRSVGRAIFNGSPPPSKYDLDVTDPDYEEFWADSITIYHNPHTKTPLKIELFEGVSQVFFEGETFKVIRPVFSPLYSKTKFRKKPL